MKRIVEHTADGSSTLFVPELNEHYHSVKGARTESQHIFIDMGMKHSSANPIRILEIGLGTGLNAFLTLTEAEQSGKEVHYTGLELYPLDWETVRCLEYSDSTLFQQIHVSPWEQETKLTPTFTLTKKKTDFTLLPQDGTLKGFDVIYFDAFAPEKQPEIWNEELFKHLYVIMNTEGILTTYCAKGIVRRMLQQAGFTVERLAGPPNGKREILRAVKNKS
ncbi:tRNA (5-methylaminomethyl-2-thiouridine)(34)-methyltransferase MnmD [Bacteroides sp. 224]|uniref:tRNA (5-methylaminomethyl-2-thiouridine)(34)-methyltransferase MnmD n=1 Tax=Bacteroides sp. 224 TaxID=2302936 RepID=UPI0013CFE5BC|nr:tRNA (5-methylaminomethyl-2-thiouridine)(34)-methyltransferase MnmD [Bacteroides sp. 224]NDV65694.1 SAM-dependent methyltransferase [Bacteroides sp. 224]